MSRRHLLLVVVGVVAVSFSSVFVRLADAPPLAVAFYRCAMASVVLVPLAWVRHRPALRALPSRDRLLLAASPSSRTCLRTTSTSITPPLLRFP
jgi:drug/metabolite transporter (DMT)-like permease